MQNIQDLVDGNNYLGIEFGSTRIKVVLIDNESNTIASGSYNWENQLKDGLWTYDLDEVWKGLQASYLDMADQVKQEYGVVIKRVGAIGFSAMMHGYLAFDDKDQLLVPFRTWRNTNTQEAADILTKTFGFNIPLRWSISHLYQAILNKEEHIQQVSYITTLAGYIHWKLTGYKVLGIDDASGMFPIDSSTKNYNERMMSQFDQLVADENLNWTLKDVLPRVLVAGNRAGVLTEEGARLIDVSRKLEPGIRLCPPEGDAATGMVATNSVAKRTGNVSAGTSVFAMVVLENELAKLHKEIDMVTTPMGDPVAMVHCNNCTSEINAWAEIFKQFANSCGVQITTDQLYTTLFQSALNAEKDCGGLVSYNYLSGEPVTGFAQGCPIMIRDALSTFNLPNFMRMQLYTSLAALKYGLDILLKDEDVKVDQLFGHGGFFKTPVVGQTIMSAATGTPVTVTENAGEGGAWGMAVLASYMIRKAPEEGLDQFLNNKVFSNQKYKTIQASKEDVDGFNQYMQSYKKCFPIESSAVECMK